jgi:hypothetical protein
MAGCGNEHSNSITRGEFVNWKSDFNFSNWTQLSGDGWLVR